MVVARYSVLTQSMQYVVSASSLVACATVLLGSVFLSPPVFAQAGLRESLDRLDRNENGRIDPDEITPLARPYLERITSSRSSGLSLDRSVEIEKLQEAAKNYYAIRNGARDRDVQPEGESTLRPFGPDADQPMIPEFGLADVKYPYHQEDLQEANETLRRYDRNDDGKIDRREAERARWEYRDPFDDDLDNDDQLSRLELVQRYARQRLLSGESHELARKARRTGSGVRPSTEGKREGDGEWWRQRGNSQWLTSSVLSRFDANKNGRLELQETLRLGIPVGQIDVDHDGELSRSELHVLLDEMQRAVAGSSDALPGWFFELDENRDGQVAMSEFSIAWTAEKIEEFESLDSNADGLLTSSEVAASKSMVGGTYRNTNAEVLPPSKTIISEITVDDEFVIGDLNVQLSITHSNVGFLDAYLTGPDGQRIELFTEVGGGGDHFDQTVFDDQSRDPITKARAPFKGSYLPEGLLKRQPSLGHFVGKNAKGVWQLVVRGTRSDRFGMLHSWGLITRPREAIQGTSPAVGQAAAQPSAHGQNREPERDRVVERGEQQLEKQLQAEARARAIAKYKEWLEKKKQTSLDVLKNKRSVDDPRSGDQSKSKKYRYEKRGVQKSEFKKELSDDR